MRLSIEKLAAFGADLSVYSGKVAGLESVRIRDAIVRRLQRIGLGWLPIPKFAGRLAGFAISHLTGMLANAIKVLPPLLWKHNIALKELLPFKVDSDFLAAGRTEEAIAYCENFLKRHPGAYRASLLLIDLYMGTERVHDAVNLADAISRKCDSAEGLYGTARRLMGLVAAHGVLQDTATPGVQRAVVAFNRALQENDSYCNIAARCLDRAIARAGGNDALHQKARYWRGILHFQQGNLDLAEPDLQAVVNSGQRFALAYALLADIREQRGQLNEAIELLSKADVQLWFSLPIIERLTRLRLAVGDVKGALEAAGRPPAEFLAHIVADVR